MALGKISRRWRICLVGIIVVAASAGTVAAISSRGDVPAATAVLGEAVFDTNYFSNASSIAGPRRSRLTAPVISTWLISPTIACWDGIARAFCKQRPRDLVIGQLDFLHTYANQGGGAAPRLAEQSARVATDSDGNLYVADLLNNRVTMYTSPFAGFTGNAARRPEAPTSLLTATNLGLSESQNLNQPAAVAVDGNNNLFVSALAGSRVLEFLDHLATGVELHAERRRLLGALATLSSMSCSGNRT